MNDLKSILETILFVYGDPLTLEKIVRVSGASEEDVLKALDELEKDYEKGGLVLLKKDNQYQLGSNPANAKYTESLVKNELAEELSRAALETLAIIAYKGPLTRVELEYVRGVNSSFILRSLLMRGLVERTENPKDARSWLYCISFDLLKHFGLKKPEDLPQYEEFKNRKIEV